MFVLPYTVKIFIFVGMKFKGFLKKYNFLGALKFVDTNFRGSVTPLKSMNINTSRNIMFLRYLCIENSCLTVYVYVTSTSYINVCIVYELEHYQTHEILI